MPNIRFCLYAPRTVNGSTYQHLYLVREYPTARYTEKTARKNFLRRCRVHHLDVYTTPGRTITVHDALS